MYIVLNVYVPCLYWFCMVIAWCLVFCIFSPTRPICKDTHGCEASLCFGDTCSPLIVYWLVVCVCVDFRRASSCQVSCQSSKENTLTRYNVPNGILPNIEQTPCLGPYIHQTLPSHSHISVFFSSQLIIVSLSDRSEKQHDWLQRVCCDPLYCCS